MPAAVSRNHTLNEPAYGSQPAPYQPGQPRRTDPHGAAGRLGLSALPSKRLGGVAESPEKWVAARRGGHPAPPVREMLEIGIFHCRSNNVQGKGARLSWSISVSPWDRVSFRNAAHMKRPLVSRSWHHPWCAVLYTLRHQNPSIQAAHRWERAPL